MLQASVNGYMHGDGNIWGAFTQRQVLSMLNEFAIEKQLGASDMAEILEWIRSLPWDGWQHDFDQSTLLDQTEDDDYTTFDNWDSRDGGLIELHFNW